MLNNFKIFSKIAYLIMISLFLPLIFSLENNEMHYLQPEGCDNRYFTLTENNLELSGNGTKLGLADCEQDWCMLQTENKESLCIDGVKFKKCNEENKERDRFKLIPVEKNYFQITANGKVTDFKNKCLIVKSCTDNTVFLGKCGEEDTIDKFKFVNKVEMPEVNVQVDDKSKLRVQEGTDKNDKNTKNIIIGSISSESSTSSDDSEIHLVKKRPKVLVDSQPKEEHQNKPKKEKERDIIKELKEKDKECDELKKNQKKPKEKNDDKLKKEKDKECDDIKNKPKKKIQVPMKDKDISVEQLGIDDSIDRINQLTSDIKQLLNCKDPANKSHPDCKVVSTDLPYSKDYLYEVDSHPEYTKVSVHSHLKPITPGMQLYQPNIYNKISGCIDNKQPITLQNPKPQVQVIQETPLCSVLNENIQK